MTSSLCSECNVVDLCNLDLRWSAVAVHQIVKATLGPRKRFVRSFPGGRNAREQLLAWLSSDDLHKKFVACPVLKICPYQEIWGTYKKKWELKRQKKRQKLHNYILIFGFGHHRFSSHQRAKSTCNIYTNLCRTYLCWPLKHWK